jgi:hypothetical protein
VCTIALDLPIAAVVLTNTSEQTRSAVLLFMSKLWSSM